MGTTGLDGLPNKLSIALRSRPDSEEQYHQWKETVDGCSYSAATPCRGTNPAKYAEKVPIFTTTFRYDAGPLLATSCFPNDNNRRRHSSGSSLPCLTQLNWGLPDLSPCLSLYLSSHPSPYLSLRMGRSGRSWLRRPSFFPSCTCLCTGHCVLTRPYVWRRCQGAPVFHCLLPLSLDLPLCTSTSWCDLGHSEATASVSLLMGKKN